MQDDDIAISTKLRVLIRNLTFLLDNEYHRHFSDLNRMDFTVCLQAKNVSKLYFMLFIVGGHWFV